ncbi:MAG: SnoaL-like domain-containing protein [Ferruginibacter sp.]
MKTSEIAERLVELCRKGDFDTAQRELYANDAVSIEPYATPAFEKETHGLDAIFKKNEKFTSMVETTHNIKVSEPVLGENSFAISMKLDITMKEQGHMNITELCVYQIKDGKIITEQFFM